MLEVKESLLPSGKHRALCVGFELDSMEELGRLLDTLGMEALGPILAHSKRISPATYIGEGKIEEIRSQAAELQAEAIALDVALSPNQLRNLEKKLKLPILDRPGVIIEIFSKHARTREAKTQVELARLQYLLPRLAHFWTHFERQRGGSPGSRGMGEKQIEVDRRLVKKRIALLKGRLKEISKERLLQRAGRKEVLKAALVGYTNAGKSTLLNALTQSSIRAEDRLFATLDASVRSLDPNCQPPIVMIDTVGFISRLPPALIASFRSTLEELHEADLLIHVVDASSPQAQDQVKVTQEVLEELGLSEKPKMMVLNKSDLVSDRFSKNRLKVLAPGALIISAVQRDEVLKLRENILKHFQTRMELWEVLIPYHEGKLDSQIHVFSSIVSAKHMDRGTFYRIRIKAELAEKLRLRKYQL